MKKIHNPLINFRYWVLISLASIFGTNTGDLAVRLCKISGIFPPEGLLGFRHAGPLPILILLFGVLHFLEKKDEEKTELFFWSAILIIRTAATNIADMLAGDLHWDSLVCSGVLSLVLIALSIAWQAQRVKPIDPLFVPETNAFYWSMMMMAGVLGTILGDYLADEYGLAMSAGYLSLGLVALVLLGYRNFLVLTPLYWLGVAMARVAGTDVGDWLAKSAEKGGSGLDLATATVISGFGFVVIALFWRGSTTKTQ
jgi:uncharacterized membrane-anchored protein